jgi:hypothetical protein
MRTREEIEDELVYYRSLLPRGWDAALISSKIAGLDAELAALPASPADVEDGEGKEG